MSSSVENRIVGMKFDNAAFQKGAATTLATLEKLKSSLDFKTTATALTGAPLGALGKLGGGLNSLLHPIQSLNNGFSAMGVIAVSALGTITAKAVSAGTQLAKSLTLDPILAGYREYETNLNSIQTILANTEASGATLKDVNAALDQLNEYSDKTIYNFSEMARNIGTFTAAGVDLDTSVASIKGIANLAALSGSNSQQASTAMYQLSQAISAGRVSLQDWNSVVNAGMGGTVFQRALANTAEAMGTLSEGSVELKGKMKNVSIAGQSFRQSITAKPGEQSWLTSKVLTNTLKQFTGDLNKAELAAMGFNNAQIKAIMQTAKTAQEAATKVKTVKQLIDVAKETIQSGWAQTWRYVFGDFKEARKTFTAASNRVNEFINGISDRRNKMLKEWKDLGGRDVLIEGIVNVFQALGSVLGPIKDAFRDIFPATTGKRLFELTEMFRDFTEGLIVSKDTQEGIRKTFRGLFAVIGIGVEIVQGILRYFFEFLGLVSEGGGSIFTLTGAIGDLLTKLHDWLVTGGLIEKFFDLLIAGREAALGPLIDVIGKVIEAFAALITSGPELFFEKLSEAGGMFSYAMDVLRDKIVSGFMVAAQATQGFLDRLGFVGSIIQGIGVAVAGAFIIVLDALGAAGDAIQDFFNIGSKGDAAASATKDAVGEVGEELESVVTLSDRVRSGLGKVFHAFANFGGFIGEMFDGFGTGFSDALGAIGTKLVDFIKNLDFRDVLNIINTLIFAGFYKTFKNFADSFADIGKSASGVLDQVRSNLKTMQTDVRANVILKIAGAVALLAASIFLLSKIDPADLGAALGAVTILIGEMVAAMIVLQKNLPTGAGISQAAQVTLISTAMVAMAGAILAMAGAVAIFGQMDLKELAKGLGAVAAVLGMFALMSAVLAKTGGGATMIATAAAMTILAFALTALAGAVKLYDAISWTTLVDGLASMALTLGVLVFAMNAMPRAGMIRAAGSLLILSGALIAIGGALKIIASLSAGDSFQAVATLAATLGLLIGAMIFAQAAIPGAAAMFTMSKALLAIAVAMKVLGSLSWTEVLIGLVALAGTLTVFGIAAAVMTPIIPVIAALAGAILLMGAAMGLAGAGMFLFASGIAILATVGTAGFAVIIAGIVGFLELLPIMVEQFGMALEGLFVVLAEAAPEFGEALTEILEAFFKAVIEAAPELGEALIVLIEEALKVLVEVTPDLVQAGYDLLLALLRGIEDNMVEISDTVISIIDKFANEVATRKNIRTLATAALTVLINFLNGLADAIRDKDDELIAAGQNIGDAIGDGVIKGLKAAAPSPGDFMNWFAPKGGLGLLGNLMGSASTTDNSSPDSGDLVGGPDDFDTPSSGGDIPLDGSFRTAFARALENGDFQATVTPVLDLTQVEQNAASLRAIAEAPVVFPEASFDLASELASIFEDLVDTIDTDEPSSGPTEIKFEQNIHAPKATSPVENYRRSKSLLAYAEEELRDL
jgi:tape measure domain-containing protein